MKTTLKINKEQDALLKKLISERFLFALGGSFCLAAHGIVNREIGDLDINVHVSEYQRTYDFLISEMFVAEEPYTKLNEAVYYSRFHHTYNEDFKICLFAHQDLGPLQTKQVDSYNLGDAPMNFYILNPMDVMKYKFSIVENALENRNVKKHCDDIKLFFEFLKINNTLV